MLIGARTAAWGGGKSDPYHGYVANGLVACFDGEDGWTDTTWDDLCGNAPGFILNGNGRVGNHLEISTANKATCAIGTVAGMCPGNYTMEMEIDGTNVADYANEISVNTNGWSLMTWGSSTLIKFVQNVFAPSRTVFVSVFSDRSNLSYDVFANGTSTHKTTTQTGDIYWLSSNWILWLNSIGLSLRGFRLYDRMLTQEEITANYNNCLTKTW